MSLTLRCLFLLMRHQPNLWWLLHLESAISVCCVQSVCLYAIIKHWSLNLIGNKLIFASYDLFTTSSLKFIDILPILPKYFWSPFIYLYIYIIYICFTVTQPSTTLLIAKSTKQLLQTCFINQSSLLLCCLSFWHVFLQRKSQRKIQLH